MTLMNTSSTDMISTLYETPPKYYQQSVQLVPLNTHFTTSCRHILHQQEVDKTPKNFSTKVFHIYNLQIYAVDLAKEYRNSPRFKDIYL